MTAPTRTRAAPRAAKPAAPDLRHRILEAAADLLREEGVAALSMREVARRAGVTHQAPYHHFADREAILAELVTGGFAMLADRLARANDGATRHGARRLVYEAGRAYVDFALEQPGRFRIMFRPELCDPARYPAAAAEGDRAHGELMRMVTILHGAPDEALATLHWSQVHGLASLMLDGGLADKMPSASVRRAHVEAVLQAYAAIAAPESEAESRSAP
ncbi:MAG: TetR/AcrR family transcriptional regulator [Burkholderiales bacterium]|nr:MAG: TetR/AcrR family transcriptional regulator [Burkholderiales bacterium]